MATGTDVITTQPGNSTTTSTTQPVTSQPSTATRPAQSSDQASYADSDTHAQQFYCGCMRCCQACCANGEDERWYYPWDKGPLCCLPLGCGWFFVCLLFPCSLCIPSCRNIICLVDEGAWDGTCFGACICGIPRTGTGRQRSNSEDSD